MKATGIVRRIDDLGRVVIPKEIRRTMRICEGSPLEIFTDREGEVILKKYSPMMELTEIAQQYVDALFQVTGLVACVTDLEQVLAVAGGMKKELLQKNISTELEEKLQKRTFFSAECEQKEFIDVTETEISDVFHQALAPILCQGDVIGGVLFLSREKQRNMDALERTVLLIAAAFLGKQMEG